MGVPVASKKDSCSPTRSASAALWAWFSSRRHAQALRGLAGSDERSPRSGSKTLGSEEMRGAGTCKYPAHQFVLRILFELSSRGTAHHGERADQHQHLPRSWRTHGFPCWVRITSDAMAPRTTYLPSPNPPSGCTFCSRHPFSRASDGRSSSRYGKRRTTGVPEFKSLL